MEEIRLDAARREIVGKRVKHLRREGAIPGILYGHHVEPLSLQVQQRALEDALQVAGANRLITLTVEGLEEPRKVLVRDLQRDSISHSMLHVDFYEVIMTEKLTAEIPITFVGVPPVVKSGEGLLFEGLDSLEIECLPGDLPGEIIVDISILEAIDEAILVRDLKVGDAVEVLTDADEVVVKILAPEIEEIEEEVVAEEVPEVELVRKPAEGEAEAEPATSEEEE
jgi:large subunit ribosomal protein L25